MGMCLLEVPTIQDDGVVHVFWVQRFLDQNSTLEILGKVHQALEGLEQFGLGGRHLDLDHHSE